MPAGNACAAVLLLATLAMAQDLISFPTEDNGLIYADRYGHGEHAVLLAHGARFNKESWQKQARILETAGYLVLAIDFRGRGQSRAGTDSKPPFGGIDYDVLGAVRYLRKNGATTVSIIGASMGGYAAAQAAVEAHPGEIDRLILLASPGIQHPERMPGRKLFIVSRDDKQGDGVSRLAETRKQYDQAPGPKELSVLDGSAHAQFIFETPQGELLMQQILHFLAAP